MNQTPPASPAADGPAGTPGPRRPAGPLDAPSAAPAAPASTSTSTEGPLATGPLGMALLGFDRAPEDTAFPDTPVTYCLTALWHRGRVLLVRERARGCWELPGGGVDPGETPRRAAAREAWEETGQRVAPEELAFLGFTRTSLPHRGTLRGALFQAEVERPAAAFEPNAEIAAVHWWDLTTPPPGGPLQTVNAYLVTRVARPARSR